jgi:hypothetical protein
MTPYEAFQNDVRRRTPKSGPPVPNMGGIVPDQHQATPRTEPAPGINTGKPGRPADISKPLTPVSPGQMTGAAPLLVPPQLGGQAPRTPRTEFDLQSGKFVRR